MSIFRRRRLETNLEREARLRREARRRSYDYEPIVVVPVVPIIQDSDWDGTPDIVDATPYGHHEHVVVVEEHHNEHIVVEVPYVDYGTSDNSYVVVEDAYNNGSSDSYTVADNSYNTPDSYGSDY